MKTVIIAIALAVASFGTFAQTQSASPNTAAQKTRAEVRAELQTAIASGERRWPGEDIYVPPQPVTQSRLRADVLAELHAAIASGAHQYNGEESFTPAAVRKAQRVFARSQAKADMAASAR